MDYLRNKQKRQLKETTPLIETVEDSTSVSSEKSFREYTPLTTGD